MSLKSNGNGRLLPTLLGRVLDYMSAPWRAVAVAVLLVLGGIGYGAWVEREWFKQVFSAPIPPKLNERASSSLPELLVETTADLATLWTVDLSTNSARFRTGVLRGGSTWSFEPRTLPMFTARTLVRFSKIISGTGDCEDLTDVKDAGPLVKRLMAEQMTFGCFEPVPPGDDGLVAVIGMMWHRKPDPAEAQGALIAAGRIGREMLK